MRTVVVKKWMDFSRKIKYVKLLNYSNNTLNQNINDNPSAESDELCSVIKSENLIVGVKSNIQQVSLCWLIS